MESAPNDVVQPSSSTGSPSMPRRARRSHRSSQVTASASASSTATSSTATRGPCSGLKSSRIVRSTGARIPVMCVQNGRRPLDPNVDSLFSHDVGAIIRAECAMVATTWKKLPAEIQHKVIRSISVSI